MKSISLVVLLMFNFLTFSCLAEDKAALIKTADDAEKIGAAIAEVVYGKRVERQKPYIAKLDGDVWVVRGTLHYDKGGVFEIKINKFDSAVIDVTHGK